MQQSNNIANAIANARIFAEPAPAQADSHSDVILYSWVGDDPFDYRGRRDDDRHEYGDCYYDEFTDEYYDVNDDDRAGSSDDEEKRHPMLVQADPRFCLGLGNATANAVAGALLEIDHRLIGHQVNEIRWAQLFGALHQEIGRGRDDARRSSSAPVPLTEAIDRMLSERLTRSDSVIADLGDGLTLELTEPHFAGWLCDAMTAAVGA